MLGRGIRAALAALVIAVGLAGTDMRPGGAAGCNLQPTLRDITVNQGLASYSPLVRGKETLVRVYLSKPNCATAGDRIEVTSASLTVSGGASTGSIPSTPAIGAPYPLVPDAAVAPLHDGSGDPTFVLPGRVLASGDTSTFGMSFTPRIGYRATSATGTVTTGEVQLASRSATVGRPSNALSILVVPMGATSAGHAAQFPSTANAALQNGMAALGRTLPVRDGVADLAGGPTDAGLRYALAPTMLDVGPTGLNLMRLTQSGLRFCGTGSNFLAIANKLAEFRQAWNSTNPTAPADVVVGAVWQDVSFGAADRQGCDEGRAWVVGTEAWVRVTSDTNGGAASTGPVLEMEVLHDFGTVTREDPRYSGGYHSRNTEADVTAPDRAFNTGLRAFLPDDRSAMQFDIANWTNRNVLLEKEDWAIAQCKLTPGTACAGAGTVGTASAGTQSFTLAGTVTETAGVETADVHSAFVEGAVQHVATDPTSPYTIVQLNGLGTVVRTDRIPVQDEQSEQHDHFDGSHELGHGKVVDAAVPTHGSTVAFELRSGTRTLHRRERGTQPQIVSPLAPVPGDPFNHPSSALDDRDPTLSSDGVVLAWSTPAGVRVARTDGAGTSATVTGATGPALVDAGDGTYRLAFVRGADLFVATVTVTAGGVGVSDETLVYLAAAQTFPDAAAHRPAWAPSADVLAVEIADDTWLMDIALPPANPLVCEVVPLPTVERCSKLADDAAAPAWSAPLAGHPEGRIAAERGGTLVLLDPAVPGGAPQATGISGSRPAFGGPLLVFAGADGIFAVDGRDEAPADPLRLTTGVDAAPALRGDGRLLALDRGPLGLGEIVLVELGAVGTVSFAATGADVDRFRADVFLDCGGSVPPILTGLRPVVKNGVAYFNAPYDSTPACRPADILARVTNGYLTSTEKVGEIEDLQPPPEGPPVPAIAAPYDGSELLQYDAIPFAGSGRDADDEDDVTLSWSLTGPPGSGIVDVPLGTGARLPDKAPPRPEGWAPGQYVVTLTATDAVGRTAGTSVRVVIKEDKDGDRIPADRELPCLGGGGDLDPTNAYGDPDGDVIASLQDPAPCTSAENATVDFEPNTLYVPSSGNTVTVHVTGPTVAGVDRTTVVLERVAGFTVRLPALSWSVDAAGRGTAKFDKQKLNAAIARADLVGLYVPMIVTARGIDGVPISTHDRTAPVTSPGN